MDDPLPDALHELGFRAFTRKGRGARAGAAAGQARPGRSKTEFIGAASEAAKAARLAGGYCEEVQLLEAHWKGWAVPGRLQQAPQSKWEPALAEP